MALQLWTNIRQKLLETSFEEVVLLRPEIDEMWSLMTSFKVDCSELRSSIDNFFTAVEGCLSKRADLLTEETLQTERLESIRSRLASALANTTVLASEYEAQKVNLEAMEARIAQLKTIVLEKHQQYLQSEETVKTLTQEERTLLAATSSEDGPSALQKLDELMENARELLNFNAL